MKKIKITLVFVFVMSISFAQVPAFKVEVKGKGQPVIFLPGFTTPGSVWNETVANLENKHEVHLISYAGFNGNDPIEMPWYQSIKDELLTYIKKEKLKNVYLIGHSMGGNLAMNLAAELSDRVKGLLLVDAIPNMREIMMPGVAAENILYDSPYNNQMLEMGEEQFKGMAGMMAANMTLKEDKIPLLIQWTLEADRKTYVYGFTDLLKLDSKVALPKIKAKTLILAASLPDAAMAKNNFEKQYVGLENKSIEMAPESKHFIMFDQPEWFYQKVNTFLADEF